MTTPGDRYAGYLPPPGAERQTGQPNWNTGYGRSYLGDRKAGFQRDGSFLSATGDSISLQFQNDGRGSYVNSFRITNGNGNLVESGSRDDGTWQTQNGRWNDLVNVRTGRDRNNGNEGYIAFERENGKTDIWKSSGRQFTTDSRRPPMDINNPSERGVGQPVTRSIAPDGSVTDFHYTETRDGRGFHSQLQSYAVRDREGNIKEFSCRNNDGHGSFWVSFKPRPGEAGLLPGVSRADQEDILRRTQEAAADGNQTPLPAELAGQAVRNPYRQAYSESVSRDGHRYETGYNGERTCNGDDGKTYHWHANGMQSVTRTLPDGRTRMLSSDSGTLADQGVVKDNYGYDKDGHINRLVESPRDAGADPSQRTEYRKQDGQWQVKQDGQWAVADVDIRNNNDGSVTIAKLQHPGFQGKENHAVSSRTIYPDGGESISERCADGKLHTTEILSATGEHSMLRYNRQGKLSEIDQSTVANDAGVPRTVRYVPSTNGHWQRVTEGPDGQRHSEDLPAEPVVGRGEVSFGAYAHIDHRGDLGYAERMARSNERYQTSDADMNGDGGYYGPNPGQFRLPRWMLPPGTRPSDYARPTSYHLPPVGYEGSYYPVNPPQPNYNGIPWASNAWDRGYPRPEGDNYYSRRRPHISVQFRF